jgi:hypothetical protein
MQVEALKDGRKSLSLTAKTMKKNRTTCGFLRRTQLHGVGWLVGWSVDLTVGRLVGRSVGLFVCLLVVCFCLVKSVSQLVC